ncbi:MAG: 2-hydroxychromene-2-carboxylate isomerase [Candidatus Lambdaproteobacteria bacterium]|nr:2-hydroxychromene-2-carboxylate isomerase [Candidatus Lambdaproteobacteria bacterium]
MGKTVDYYLATTSPFTYLGHARMLEMAQRHGAVLNYKPIDALDVFAVSGGLPLNQRPPQRQAYRLAELKRWRDHLGLPLNLQPQFFPVPGKLAACAVIAAMEAGADPGGLIGGILKGVWAEERNIEDPVALRQIAVAAGYDRPEFVDRAAESRYLQIYAANTREAIARNVFGVPTYIVDEELFWGQDRLEFVERALRT